MLALIDPTDLDFDAKSLVLLNAIIALMMFGVSLTLRTEDFARVVREPRAPAAGMIGQFLLLPSLTWALTMALPIKPEFALGMLLVAACPGGSMSNIMTWLARGNLAASISMTAISSLAAVVMTPLNFAFWANMNPGTRAFLREIDIQAVDILLQVLLVLGVPILLGMFIGARFPEFAARTDKPMRWISLAVFIGFLTLAFARNAALFVEHLSSFFGLVVLHNAIALTVGWLIARAARLNQADTRAVTLETGLQNSGLGLVIIFTTMPTVGGAILITAFWGVWHLVSGLALSSYWARKPITDGSDPRAITPGAAPA